MQHITHSGVGQYTHTLMVFHGPDGEERVARYQFKSLFAAYQRLNRALVVEPELSNWRIVSREGN